MSLAAAIFPTTWSRERRSYASIAVSIAGLLLFLYLMPVPLSWMPEPIGSGAAPESPSSLPSCPV